MVELTADMKISRILVWTTGTDLGLRAGFGGREARRRIWEGVESEEENQSDAMTPSSSIPVTLDEMIKLSAYPILGEKWNCGDLRFNGGIEVGEDAGGVGWG